MRKRYFAVLAALLLFMVTAGSLRALNVPQLQGRVNDYAGILQSQEKNELDA